MIYGYLKSKLTGNENVWTKILKVPESYRFKLPKVLNQGQKPICTVCACSAFLNWNINLKDGNSTRDNNIPLDKIFKTSKGTSEGAYLKEVLNTCQLMYHLSKYALIKNPDQLKSAILANGPCVAGLTVKDDQRTDFWRGSGNLGGHAIALVGWNKDGFIIRNSWGDDWGDYGYTTIPYSDFNKFNEVWTIIA